jgi:hypothetical protein
MPCLQFDGVLENVSQDVVYNSCVHEAVDSSLAGYNATVFAYGQVRHSRGLAGANMPAGIRSCAGGIEQHCSW